jgi:hypothetical protein
MKTFPLFCRGEKAEIITVIAFLFQRLAGKEEKSPSSGEARALRQ